MNNKILILIAVILIFFVFPPLVNLLMTFGHVETDNDWIGFFGSYIGALIGAGVAVTVSIIQSKGASRDLLKQMDIQSKQVKERIDNEIKTLKLSNRVFIDYTMRVNTLLLSELKEDETKILLPKDIYTFIKHNPNDYLEDFKAQFVKFEFYGSADCVLDIKIKITRSAIEGEEDTDRMYLAGWRKEHSIYIPITVLNPHGSRELLKLEVEYSTLLQERIIFVSDMITRSESYTLKENGHEQVIYERDLINEYYILPGNKGSSN